MAQTKQFVSPAYTQEEDTDVTFPCYQAVKEAKANIKENIQLLDSVCDTMNSLCAKLDRLDNLTESLIFGKEKEKSSPQTEFASFRGNASMMR